MITGTITSLAGGSGKTKGCRKLAADKQNNAKQVIPFKPRVGAGKSAVDMMFVRRILHRDYQLSLITSRIPIMKLDDSTGKLYHFY
jgi:dethiobiotin synthetase